jgi:integrase
MGFRNEAKEKTITDAQFERFIEAVKFVEEDRYVTFWENVYYCAAYLGLRSIETCKLRIEDIDFLERTLTLPEQKNKVRYEKIVIPDFMLDRLKDHITRYKNEIIANGIEYTNVRDTDTLRGDYYLFWRQKNKRRRSGGIRKEKHLATNTIRTHLNNTRKTAGLDMKYGMTVTGHILSILSYHTLRHYYLQKICDQRGVFAAQISGRHKNLRSTERYLTTSLTAKKDIVNDVFNTQISQESHQMTALKDEISELKALMKQSVILSGGHKDHIRNQNRIAMEEAEGFMQNRALYQARQIKRTVQVEETKEIVSTQQM